MKDKRLCKFDKVFIFLFAFASIIFIIYLFLPNPSFPAKLPKVLQSNEPADTETPLRRGYYTNYLRSFVVKYYENEFNRIGPFFVPTYILNYPPEDAQTLVRDQTRSTYLEEVVHPFRESIFVSGFEPKLAKDAININGMHWQSKVIVKYVPSSRTVRVAIGFLTLLVTAFIYKEYRYLMIGLLKNRTQ